MNGTAGLNGVWGGGQETSRNMHSLATRKQDDHIFVTKS